MIAMTIGIRLGKVGLLAALQDSDAMRLGLGNHFTKYRPLTLRRNQRHELCMYLYINVYIIQMLHSTSSPSSWASSQYISILLFHGLMHGIMRNTIGCARLSRISFEHLYFGDTFRTCLDDEEGNPRPWPSPA